MLNHIARSLLRGQFARHFGAGRGEQVCEKVHPKFKRLKELQRKFSCDDGVPVYLKGGNKDKILFQVTVAGLGVGLLMAANVLYRLIVPGANQPPPIEGIDDDD